ncbi:MAG: hypothetical protein FWD57_07360 [Polyangiaceae bacterium]|nr:hypothetical protein [Polyangiaceae bacterium]
MNEKPESLPPVVQLSVKAAELLGYKTRVVDSAFGFLFEVSKGKEARYFVGGVSPLNDAVAARIAQDKFYTSMALADRGFRVPEGVRCIRASHFTVNDFSDRSGVEPGVAFARRVGYPVIVKPNRGALGRDVTCVGCEEELLRAIDTVWNGDYIALVQRVVAGADIRLDFLDGSYLVGYRRSPIVIRGDGQKTIGSLLEQLDRRFGDDAIFARRRTEPIWEQRVISRGWSEATVLGDGESISFESPVLNLNRWATANLVEELPYRWLRYCMSVAETLRLRHFGLDLRVPVCGDASGWIDVPPEQAVVIEVNASPALVQFHDLGYADRAIEGQSRVLRAAFGQ